MLYEKPIEILTLILGRTLIKLLGSAKVLVNLAPLILVLNSVWY